MLAIEPFVVAQFEDVEIELVHVGDYVRVQPTGSRALPACVVAKIPTRSGGSERATGWQVVLANGSSLFLPRHSTVQRRRFETEPAWASPRLRRAG